MLDVLESKERNSVGVTLVVRQGRDSKSFVLSSRVACVILTSALASPIFDKSDNSAGTCVVPVFFAVQGDAKHIL